MKEFAALKAKTYSYLTELMMKIEKQKTQKVFHKTKLKFKDYRNCLQTTQLKNSNSTKKNILIWIVLDKVMKNS